LGQEFLDFGGGLGRGVEGDFVDGYDGDAEEGYTQCKTNPHIRQKSQINIFLRKRRLDLLKITRLDYQLARSILMLLIALFMR